MSLQIHFLADHVFVPNIVPNIAPNISGMDYILCYVMSFTVKQISPNCIVLHFFTLHPTSYYTAQQSLLGRISFNKDDSDFIT